MVEEAYCPIEYAKRLQELGFPLEASNRPYVGWAMGVKIAKKVEEELYSNITHQIALRWLREEKNIYIDICTLSPMAYCFRVSLISNTTGYLYENYVCEEGERFYTYEDAVLQALDYVLNNILEEE